MASEVAWHACQISLRMVDSWWGRGNTYIHTEAGMWSRKSTLIFPNKNSGLKNYGRYANAKGYMNHFSASVTYNWLQLLYVHDVNTMHPDKREKGTGRGNEVITICCNIRHQMLDSNYLTLLRNRTQKAHVFIIHPSWLNDYDRIIVLFWCVWKATHAICSQGGPSIFLHTQQVINDYATRRLLQQVTTRTYGSFPPKASVHPHRRFRELYTKN
jgi:hypothetical protein